MKTAAVVTALALVGGSVGGLLLGQRWYDGAYIAVVAAVIALLLYVLWKRPLSVADALMNESAADEPPPTPAVPKLEQEVRRKDRGEVRGDK
jgi:hypothetical protein